MQSNKKSWTNLHKTLPSWFCLGVHQRCIKWLESIGWEEFRRHMKYMLMLFSVFAFYLNQPYLLLYTVQKTRRLDRIASTKAQMKRLGSVGGLLGSKFQIRAQKLQFYLSVTTIWSDIDYERQPTGNNRGGSNIRLVTSLPVCSSPSGRVHNFPSTSWK
jgi:hypothetical protein